MQSTVVSLQKDVQKGFTEDLTCINVSIPSTYHILKDKPQYNSSEHGMPVTPHSFISLLFLVPNCSRINTEQRCFYSDPSCPNR
jgi:hypothetical protein